MTDYAVTTNNEKAVAVSTQNPVPSFSNKHHVGDKLQNKNAVAIIGMGCVFPKANGLKQFWRLLFNGEDAITEVPEESHWSLEDYFNSDPSSRDRTYCSRGGFIPRVSFDPAKFGLPPNNLDATDTSQLLALIVAEAALKDAGYGAPGSFDRLRTNVILGVTGTQELVIPLGARLGHPIWKKALKESGISDQKSAEVVERISGQYAEWQENSFPGLLGNVVAGRIANRLDLGGTNSVVDAACASSLSAINTAIMELVSGRCDMSITGGVDALNDIFMNMCFAKTGVLSHSGDARPFSKDADGTVLGEGVGMIVLKRLSDAKRDKDRIYAVIRGIGTSSDGRTGGIYAPDAAGQLRALHSAYDLAGVDPATVGLIEAHGTGTRVGDKIEFTALKTLAQESGKTTACALGSVKSMIGHSKAAAGAAGIIKSALCLYHKVLPPTLKAETPDPELGINNTPFYLNADAKPWVSRDNSLRRSGVSAFGFGGSNFHAVLEENEPEKTRVSWDGTVQIAAFSAATRQEIKEKLLEFTGELAQSAQWDQAERTAHTAWLCFKARKSFSNMDSVRILILIAGDDDGAEAMQRAVTLVNDEHEQSWTRENIYFGSGPQQGKLAFLFPGQGSQYTGMGRDIISIFPEGLKALEEANRHFARERAEEREGEDQKEPLNDYMFPPPLHCRDKKTGEEMLRKTDVAQPALGCVSLAMARVLQRFNILPDLACGHSFGELTALYSAGWIDSDTFLTLAAARGRYMAEAQDKGGEQGSMMAMMAALPEIENFIRDENLDLILANRNSHDQGVLSGRTDEIKKALKLCKERKIRAVELPVAAAFHSPLVENAALPFKKRLKQFGLTPSGTAVFSNTFAKPYPRNAKKAEEILGNQLLNPVNFVTSIEAMFADNATTFVEVGPKGVLTGLTRSILKDKRFTAMALDGSNGRRSGIEDLARVVCELAAQGFPVNLAAWEEDADEPGKKMMRVPLTGANIRPRPGCDLPVSPPKTTLPADALTTSNDPGPARSSGDKDQGSRPAKTHEALHVPPHGKLHKNSGSAQTPGKENKGTVMPTSKPDIYQSKTPIRINQPRTGAVEILYRGLESMEALQSQTARAHERFLDTQALASQTLQKMMEQTRLFAESGFAAETRSGSAIPHPGSHNEEISNQVYSPGAVPEPPEPVATPGQTGHEHSTEPMTDKPAPRAKPNHIPGHIKGRLPEAQPVLSSAPPSAAPEALGTDRAAQTIMATVSRLTGFPQEMLELDMEIESDLGIDSIKRVEIVSELERELPNVSFAPEEMGTLKTLQDILNTIVHLDVSEPGEKAMAEPLPADGNSQIQGPATMTILVGVIGELTGFPVEMLEPDMDLESDLGIDSIKRVEILSRLEQELPNARTFSPEKMAELKTLADIASHIDDSSSETATVQTTADSSSPEPVASKGETSRQNSPAGENQSAPGDASLMRQTVKIKQLTMDQVRFHNGSRVTIPESKTVFIAGGTTNFSTALARGFNRAGIKTQVISMDGGLESDPASMAGLVIVYDKSKDARAFLKSAFLLAKKSGPALMDSAREQGAFFTTVSFLGGSFGFDDPDALDQALVNPIQGGLAGLAKTAGLEWSGVLCRSLDLESSFLPEDRPMDAVANLAMIHGPVEMGVKGELCNIPELVKTNAAPGTTLIEINQDDVFVISGGARGVTARCALSLAQRCRPTIVLLGRSPEPRDEPQWLNGLTDETDIKRRVLEHEFTDKRPSPRELDTRFRQIVSNREIIKTLEEIRAANARAAYFSIDVLDARQVANCLEKVKTQMGPITGIIHGAGVVADRFIIDKDEALFSRVFDTKVQGLENLLSAVKTNSLKHLVLFSSIAARMGNPGQVDYSMANEALNKMAQDLSRRLPWCKTLSVNWGPWEGGMVTPLLRQKFERLGIDLIPLEAGAAKLIHEMGSSGPVEVIIGGHLPAPVPDQPKRKTNLIKAYGTEVGTALFPILEDHSIAGQPVVPLALMVEWFAHGARHVNPGLTFAGMDDVRVLKGIKPGADTTGITVNTDKCRLDKGLFRVETELCSDDSIHARGTTLLAETLDKSPDHPPQRPKKLKPCSISVAQAYDSILFHRGRLRGIKAIPAIGTDGITVSAARAKTPGSWMEHPHAARWSMDPLVLDCAFQAAIIWSHEQTGKACLPSHFSSLRLYEHFASSTGEVLITLTVTEKTAHSLKGDFSFVDDSNRVIAAINGFEAIMDPGLMEKFKPGKAEKKTAKKKKNDKRPEEQHKQAVCFTGQEILAFAEGRPSQAFGEPYTIFDEQREIARLPRPPFLFMDRIVRTDAVQWEMTPGGWIEAEFDLPRDAWYFKSARSSTLPFAILLEIALQPCGWLAAYAGSALKSDDRLYFRNLGGEATLVRPVTRNMGTLTMRARITKVSEAGGLIIQDFEMEVLNQGEPLYRGKTGFGFFTKKSLSNQTGIRSTPLDHAPSKSEIKKSVIKATFPLKFKDDAPLTPGDDNVSPPTILPSKALRMIDTIDVLTMDAGVYGKGYVRASKIVNPEEWFFKAHFYQDPVCPGSLGIESFLQTIAVYAGKKWKFSPQTHSLILAGQDHRWTYRGQITPENKEITIEAHIKSVYGGGNGENPTITADGILKVDGMIIYQMENFTLELVSLELPPSDGARDRAAEPVSSAHCYT
jgi:acyl transferase domain-containing protein/3-hydroxymyristoyl/3-hydroxydecanoyl-(acyl carrier protein) dehydratase/NAD(P)-dependent dehydrogenase (short-subunit alcohol dehydrogenase family)